jgi:hypothetical protein
MFGMPTRFSSKQDAYLLDPKGFNTVTDAVFGRQGMDFFGSLPDQLDPVAPSVFEEAGRAGLGTAQEAFGRAGDVVNTSLGTLDQSLAGFGAGQQALNQGASVVNESLGGLDTAGLTLRGAIGGVQDAQGTAQQALGTIGQGVGQLGLAGETLAGAGDTLGAAGANFQQNLIPGAQNLANTGFRTDIDPIRQQMLNEFRNVMVPELANQFGSLGGGGQAISSDFGGALAREGSNLYTNLGAIQAQLDEASAGRRVEGLGLGGQFGQGLTQVGAAQTGLGQAGGELGVNFGQLGLAEGQIGALENQLAQTLTGIGGAQTDIATARQQAGETLGGLGLGQGQLAAGIGNVGQLQAGAADLISNLGQTEAAFPVSLGQQIIDLSEMNFDNELLQRAGGQARNM